MSILDKYTISEPSDEKSKALLDQFKGKNRVIQLQPGGWTYLRSYRKLADPIAELECFDDDVYVVTFPKSGTTWMQEIVWTMTNNPTLDLAKLAVPLHIRAPSIESDITIADQTSQPQSILHEFKEKFPNQDPSKGMMLHVARMSPRPRTIKTHMPLELLNPKLLETSKVVYVIRDPRDVCLSYMHHSRIFLYEDFQGDLNQYIDAFIGGLVYFGPFWPHVSKAWAERNHPNMRIIFFEKLKINPKSEYQKLNEFLGTQLSPEQLDKVIEFTSFAEMKKRGQHCLTSDDEKSFLNEGLQQKDGGFFRKGTSGGWRKVLNEAQKDKFEAWIKKNCPDQEIMNNILNP